MPIEDFAQRQEAKRDRLEERADKAAHRADQAQRTADAIFNGIPLGQPILVGHHSEKRHRRDLDRAGRAMDRTIEESKKADHLRQRAEGLGQHGISSDDPTAPDQLTARIAELEAKRDRMKAINVAVRAAQRVVKKRTPPGDEAAALAEAVAAGGITYDEAKKLASDFAIAPYHGLGIASYALTNLGANIRRLKDRLTSLSRTIATQATTPPKTREGTGYVIAEDYDENRVTFRYTRRPSPEVCQAMRQIGFHWNRTLGAWTRLLNSSAWHAAGWVADRIDRGELTIA